MKKSIALVFGFIGGILIFAGCSGNAQTFISEEYTADVAVIQKISIDVHDRQIDVSSTPDSQICISYSQSSQEGYDIAVNGDVLTMTAADNKVWEDYIGVKPDISNRKIELTVPEEMLSVLELSTTNEDIILPTLTISDSVQLTSEGGNVEFTDLDAGRAISLSAKNGSIRGTIVGSSSDFAVQTDTKKGTCNLEDSTAGSKKLDVYCNNGDVDIVFSGD